MTNNSKNALNMEIHTAVFKYLRYFGECDITVPQADEEAQKLTKKFVADIIEVENKYQVKKGE